MTLQPCFNSVEKSLKYCLTYDSGGLEGEGEKVREWEPIPVLGEHEHAHHTQHIGVPSPRLKADGHVTATRIYDTLGEDGTKLGHHILVLVVDNLKIPH